MKNGLKSHSPVWSGFQNIKEEKFLEIFFQQKGLSKSYKYEYIQVSKSEPEFKASFCREETQNFYINDFLLTLRNN